MQPKSPPNPGRRKFLISATSAVGAVGVAGAVVPFISAFNPSAAAEAAGAPAVADIGKLAPGEMIIVEWRGTPIYVVKHTDESIKEIDKNLERLADPNSETQVQPDYAKNKYKRINFKIYIIDHNSQKNQIESFENESISSAAVMLTTREIDEVANFSINNPNFDMGIHLTVTS